MSKYLSLLRQFCYTFRDTYIIFTILLKISQAGWLPWELDSLGDLFPFIKPKEVYHILSALWKYLKVSPLGFL